MKRSTTTFHNDCAAHQTSIIMSKMHYIEDKPRAQETKDAWEGSRSYDEDDANSLPSISCMMGTRNILSFDAKRGKSLVKFYYTYSQAIQDLERILKAMESSADLAVNVDPIVQKLRVVVQEKFLQRFLGQKCIVPLLKKNRKSELHYQLANWLCRLVQSAGLGTHSLANLATAALATLLSLRRHGKLSKTVFVAASLEHFCLSLECWVNLSLSQKPQATSPPLPEQEFRSRNNLAGLANLLQFWDATLANSNFTNLPYRDATATKCIVALSRLGLDHVVSSHTIGLNLRSKLQRVIAKLLELATTREGCDRKDDRVEWMDTTAEAVLQGVSDLGPDPLSSEDMDEGNTDAWLSYSVIARLFPIVDSNDEARQPSNQFKAILSMQAIKILLQVDDMSSRVQTILNETDNQSILKRANSSLGWLAISCSYVALIEVDISVDGPRCLAIVECALSAFQAGMLLLINETGRQATAEYGNEEKADEAAHMMELFDLECLLLLDALAPSASLPYFCQVVCTLHCCRDQYCVMKARVTELSESDEKIDHLLSGSKATSPISG
jgi:hypothetical protein